MASDPAYKGFNKLQVEINGKYEKYCRFNYYNPSLPCCFCRTHEIYKIF